MTKSTLTDKNFRPTIAQIEPILGDMAGNLEKLREARANAAKMGSNLLIPPPFFISGHPLHDLHDLPHFNSLSQQALATLAQDTDDGGPAILGTHHFLDDAGLSHDRFFLLEHGKIDNHVDQSVFNIGGVKIAVSLHREGNTYDILKKSGAQFIIVFSADAYHRGQPQQRLEDAQRSAEAVGLPLFQVNSIGAQDGLVFAGGSFGVQADGRLAFQMAHFSPSHAMSQWEETLFGWQCVEGMQEDVPQGAQADYSACMLGLRSYVNKNGFAGVLLGLSGGVDSALVAALAVDALGADRVRTVMLPYHYTAADSLQDAQECAKLLGCDYQIMPILAPVEGFLAALAPAFAGMARDVTEENLQSRARGTLLMALSNKLGVLLLTTGNKSEGAVGYATLYGDMCGGFNPIKDLYKKHVYALCDWRNNNHPVGALGPQGRVIPQNILDKAPSAELRDNQKDEDTLPPYPILDEILEALIEGRKSAADVVAEGFDAPTVKRVEHLLYGAEYKRRQSAPGIKISPRSFDHDWHMPLNHRFRLPYSERT